MEGRKFFRECSLGSCQLRLTMVSSVTVDMGCFLSLPSLNAAPGSFVSQLPAPCLCLSYVACQTAPAICISPIFVSLLKRQKSGTSSPNIFKQISGNSTYHLPFQAQNMPNTKPELVKSFWKRKSASPEERQER